MTDPKDAAAEALQALESLVHSEFDGTSSLDEHLAHVSTLRSELSRLRETRKGEQEPMGELPGTLGVGATRILEVARQQWRDSAGPETDNGVRYGQVTIAELYRYGEIVRRMTLAASPSSPELPTREITIQDVIAAFYNDAEPISYPLAKVRYIAELRRVLALLRPASPTEGQPR